MIKLFFFIASFLLTVTIVGCGQGENSVGSGKTEIGALKVRLDAAEEKIARLEKFRIQQWMESLNGPQDSASFDPQEDQAYSPVRAPSGTMLFVLEKVEPYLDGFVVSMRVGNPSSATYSGMSGTVKWGRAFDIKKDPVDNELSEKKIDLRDTFPAGAWTAIKFNIAPAKADELRRIVIEPKFDQLQLRRPLTR